MRPIYLDYNATTPIAAAVREAMLPYLDAQFGNPSSSYALGRASQEAVADARTRLAACVGAEREEIVFTSGGTEANNLAIKGTALRQGAGLGHVVVSAIEHPATLQPAKFLERLGFGLTIVPCPASGVIAPEAVAAALRPDTILVSIMHANNEIGIVQPIAEIARLCRQRGVLCHTDAAQSLGKVPVAVQELGVDLLSIAGHKLYAPKGIGALYVRRGVALEPLLHGGGQETGLRAGTENVAQIVGLGQAASLVQRNVGDLSDRMRFLRDRLASTLGEALGERLIVWGESVERLPNTLAVSLLGAQGSDLLKRCPELCASTGAACHSGKGSATLEAMGATPEQQAGFLRLSLGWYSTEEEIDRAASLLLAAWEARDTAS